MNKYIKIRLEEKTHKAFKSKLANIGATMQDWIETKINTYVEQKNPS
jgi:antitoxin component of RelBE/YafQ-DinJ toxin-antitoxin module